MFAANGSMILPFLFINFQNNLIHNECAFYCENTLFFIDLIVKLMAIYDNKLKTKDIFFFFAKKTIMRIDPAKY